VEKEREAQAREDNIRNNSELALQLRRPISGASNANEEGNASSSSPPRRREQDVAEIDGRAVQTSTGHHSHADLPPTPAQSHITSLPAPPSSRIQDLESRLASQDTRIHQLEAARDDLTRQVVELKARRDEADLALVEATTAGTAAKREHEEMVASLRQQILDLIGDRRRADEEIEELRGTEKELRRELDEEREKVRRLEVEKETLERPEVIVAAPAVAASTVGVSSRRESVGESERRRHGHRRSHSSGSSLNILLEAKWGDDKDSKKKKKGSRK
jgi:hypothetical protein